MTKDNLITVLDSTSMGALLLFAGILLALMEGYQQAERRDWELRNVYGDKIPASLQVPRNLIPNRWRRVMNWTATVAVVLSAGCAVAAMIIE